MKLSVTKYCVLLAAILAAAPAVGHGDTDGDSSADSAQLGRRYNDPMWGLSIRPPASAGRMRKSPGRREWQNLDSNTGAVKWSFRVRRVFTREEPDNLKTYADKLAKQIEKQDNYKIISRKLKPVAKKAAIDFCGKSTASGKMYKRQVWIQAAPTRFLVISITGPFEIRQKLDSILQSSLGTLKVTDPGKAIQQRKERLSRGQDLLAGIDDKKLKEALVNEPQWFTVEYEGKPVGFMRVTESAAVVKDADGYEVNMVTFLDMPDDEQRLLRQRMFTTADRSVEWWRNRLAMGSGRDVTRYTEEGLKKQDVIVCVYERGDKSHTQKKRTPDDIYLPHAMGWLLGRLVSLHKPAKYSFAVYNTQRNDFGLRTFALLEPKTFKISSRPVRGFYARDKASEDAGEVEMWLNGSGVLKRMKTPEGLVMESAPRGAVTARFPQAKKVMTGE